MKSLSVMNPHAQDIKDDLKHIEVRSWSTDHRGDLLIVSSRGWDKGAITQADARSGRYKYGVALCIVELVDVRNLRDEDTHESLIAYRKDHYAWVLKNVRPVTPFPVMGRLGLYDVVVPESALAAAP